MALPGDISTVALSGKYLQLDGSPAAGTVTFTLSQSIADSTGSVILPKGGITVTLDNNGSFTISLPATDDTDLHPTGFVYQVREELTTPKTTRSYAISLPTSPSTVNLAAVAPVADVGAVSAYVLKSGDTMTGDLTLTGGNVIAGTAGKGFQVKEGSNAKMGTATLVAGTKVVSNTSVTANSRVFLTVQSLGTVTAPKAIAVTARTAGTSFTITSADATDTSVVAWTLLEPAA